MPIHRHIKNVVHNYTDAERKVREATSNDPWGPSSTLMAEIADKTHNVLAFTEIMQMIWRRLNDKSKNWRHVYKALVLLEYIIKTGSDKVATQCRENIHSIETLQDFEYFEDGKDHGHNVRAKARVLSSLLRDEERLHEERTQALNARDRLMGGGLGTITSANSFISFSRGPRSPMSGYSESAHPDKKSPAHSRSPVISTNSELDSVRPQSIGEEQLQLQLAIAISKEEHDREERRRRTEEAKEEAKVQMALEQSRREDQELLEQRRLTNTGQVASSSAPHPASSGGGLFSKLDTSLSAAPAHLPDPWSSPLIDSGASAVATGSVVNPPQSSTSSVIPIDDPWNASNLSSFAAQQPSNSPWPVTSSTTVCGPTTSVNSGPLDFLADIQPTTNGNGVHSFTSVEAANLSNHSQSHNGDSSTSETTTRRRTPADFLGEHQRLVDLEKLIETSPSRVPNSISGSTNPFAVGLRPVGGGPSANPFLNSQPVKPSLNQLAPTLALTASGEAHSDSFHSGFRPTITPFCSSGANYFMPVQTSPWSVGNMISPQNQTNLNPFY
ncbi:hypothetical protein EG68_09447 [Paragonimus skrjabini miyazakii]|uniref:ENTH domain-containing protein n=1 Tax=Paragonimus skrjabini miyazakii TaxID=59628 RepID=A0A8S9YGT6_9TREM|nr:hypothetical protein EG68_09447 [Paragonimus skrjabini miyazakii]